MTRVLLVLPLLLAADWPQWRGPNAAGVSLETVPTSWTATQGVKWKVPLPGAGNSSPVVVGNDVIVTASLGRDHSDLRVLCYDRDTGKEKWAAKLFATPAPAPFSMFPPERGHAAPTPAADANRVIVLFGSGDLAAYDRGGKPLWFRSLTTEYGQFLNDYGIAASPVLYGDTVLVQIDHGAGSYLLAADAATGRTLWKSARPGVFDNWSTPVVAAVAGVPTVIAFGTKTITGYDPRSGAETFKLTGLERLCSPTPLVANGNLYAVSGPTGALFCYDLSPNPPKKLWETKKIGPFIPSPVAAAGKVYLPDDQGNLTAFAADTGAELWRERVFTGRGRPSPIVAGGKLFVTALDGTTVVLATGDAFELLGKNPLGEPVAASFAASGGGLFVRGEKHLFCLK